jgi:hypothetical protein
VIAEPFEVASKLNDTLRRYSADSLFITDVILALRKQKAAALKVGAPCANPISSSALANLKAMITDGSLERNGRLDAGSANLLPKVYQHCAWPGGSPLSINSDLAVGGPHAIRDDYFMEVLDSRINQVRRSEGWTWDEATQTLQPPTSAYTPLPDATSFFDTAVRKGCPEGTLPGPHHMHKGIPQCVPMPDESTSGSKPYPVEEAEGVEVVSLKTTTEKKASFWDTYKKELIIGGVVLAFIYMAANKK